MIQQSVFPERFRVMSGSALKVLAMVAMLVDHSAICFQPLLNRYLFTLFDVRFTPYVLLRGFGRIAFPIFCFLLVEGFVYTHDRRRYGINLALFAILSEVPFDLCRKLTPVDITYQNVFFTLLLGYLGLCAIENLKDQTALRAICVIGLAIASMGLLCDYGPRGYALILILYVLRHDAVVKTALGCCVTLATWRAGLAFIPLNLYNGRRGFVHGPVLKYAFYAFYPLHLLVLWRLRLRLGV